MKKRLLASLLAAAMTLTMVPAAFAAEGDNVQLNDASSAAAEVDPTVKSVAQVEDKEYTSLADAIEAASKEKDVTITLLQNTTEDIIIPADATVTLDLNGKKLVNSAEPQNDKVAANERKHTITNNGTLTIEDSVGTGVVDNVSHGRAALYNNGTIAEIKGGKFERSVDNSTDSDSAKGNSWYVVYNAENANIAKISAGEFLALGHFSSMFCNSGTIGEISGGNFTQDGFIAFKNEGTIDRISGGVFSSKDESCIQNWGTIGEISGGTITAGRLGIWNFSSDKYTSLGTVNEISGGTIAGTTAAIRLNNYDVDYLNKSADTITNKASAKVTAGNINGALEVGSATELSISGGYFTTDPSAYCVAGKTGVASDNTDYPWTVGEKSATKAEVATGAPAVEASKDAAKTEADKELLQKTETALAAAKVAGNGVEIAAAKVANDNKVTANEDVVRKLNDAVGSGATAENTNIVIQTYMDMKITNVDATAEQPSITIDIQPMYRTVATTANVNNNEKIVLESDTNAVNAVEVGKPQPLTVTGKTTIVIQLPEGFADNSITKLFVQHRGYEYEATVSEDNGAYIATFENPHGFSEFTITKNSQTAAKIKDVCYTKFEDAVTAAKDNETVYVIGSDTEYKATISGASKTIKVENGKSDTITVTINNTVKTIKPQETAEFTYTKPSSGSSSGSSSSKTTYKVTTSSVANGGVNVSPSSSAKGDKVKITLSPNTGYKLDKLTVTDASGKTVSTTKTSDTVYTFTMPASQVTVGVTYVKADETTEQPSTKTFSDVASTDWFADAVKYVSDKGMMNGTGNGKFSPADSTTRAMLMTVIARYAGEDTTGSDPWYQKGMEWAKANGVSDGTEPNANITREQLVTMLYRYAKASGKDVSVGEDTNILSYADATTVSQYAIPAMQWACGAGIINGANGKLNPQNNATRAEVAAILMRFCENVK